MLVLHNRPRIFRHCRDFINSLQLCGTHGANGDNNTVSIGSAIFLARHHNGIRVSLAIIPQSLNLRETRKIPYVFYTLVDFGRENAPSVNDVAITKERNICYVKTKNRSHPMPR